MDPNLVARETVGPHTVGPASSLFRVLCCKGVISISRTDFPRLTCDVSWQFCELQRLSFLMVERVGSRDITPVISFMFIGGPY